MTQAELFAAVRALGLTITKTDGEYRIAPRLDTLGVTEHTAYTPRRAAVTKQECMAYYTNDADDALATARTMAARA